jgi:hypothetical protein
MMRTTESQIVVRGQAVDDPTAVRGRLRSDEPPREGRVTANQDHGMPGSQVVDLVGAVLEIMVMSKNCLARIWQVQLVGAMVTIS